uniref:Uncharacterized protein n=1 Tax=Anguilla anguilla TaxID=7936 RepID=A0A0E9PP17_ANGAN
MLAGALKVFDSFLILLVLQEGFSSVLQRVHILRV